MQLEKIDMGLVEYEIKAVLRLLDVFEPWFDESFKANDVVRIKDEDSEHLMWASAPNYAAVLDSSIDQLGRIYHEVKKYNDEQEQAV